MIKLGKEFAHWVIEASDPSKQGWVGHSSVHVITKDIDRAVQICHEEHPNATIHAVRKSDRWDGAGLYVDLDPYGDDIPGVTVGNPGDRANPSWDATTYQVSVSGGTDLNAVADRTEADAEIERLKAKLAAARWSFEWIRGGVGWEMRGVAETAIEAIDKP